MVDIISMVKHAAREEALLLTVEERVNAALQKLTIANSITEEQQQWLDRIRVHLIENLSIEQDYFEELPVFTCFGGWGKANRVFGNKLNELLNQINEAVAA